MIHLPHAVLTVVAFALVISVLVFVHEFGHYLAARWRGVAVEVFSIGFGRALLSWTDRTGTEWRVAALPLGGFVRMRGQSDLVPDEEPRRLPRGVVEDPWGPSRSFSDKPVASRAIIVAAGPVFNLAFAVLLFTGVYAIAGRPSDSPVVAGVVASSPAASAGIEKGDALVSIDGRPASHVAEVPGLVASHAGQRIEIVVRRAGAADRASRQPGRLVSLFATPRAATVSGHVVGQLGIQVAPSLVAHPMALGPAFVAGAGATWTLSERIGQGLWQIVSGHAQTGDLGGPLRIAQVSGQAAQAGPESLVILIAMISINLGLLNLLPVPVLDGGHLVFYAFEAVLGRPLSRRAREIGLQAGLALIACLFLFTTINDLNSFGLFRWVQSLVG